MMRMVGNIRSFAAIGVVLCAVFGCDGRSNSISSLLGEVRDGPSVKVRQDACSELARTPGDAAAEALIELLGDDEQWFCAAHGLGMRKEKLAIAPLLTQLETD